MKFVMSERVKHRLTGLVVIVSIAVIFLPAMMKKSNQHFAESMNVSLKLPSKPSLPKVVIPNQQAMFQSVKVARVDIPKLVHEQHATQIAKAEPLSTKQATPNLPIIAKASTAMPVVPAASVKPIAPKVPVVALSKSKIVALKKETYAIQLASFAQQNNAQALVSRLRGKGYVATYNKFSGKQGEYYKVIVGQLHQRDDAVNLQKKLADNLQLNGFIIKAVG